jgi:HK97 family phage major capsid protein
METKDVMKALEAVESALDTHSKKAEADIKNIGKVASDTETAIRNIGLKQLELAEKLAEIEQKSTAQKDTKADESIGAQVVKSEKFAAFARGDMQKARIEVKNTMTGDSATVAPDRKPGIVGGAFQMLTMEAFLDSVPTSSNAVEFTKETLFTNNAAETAEGGSKPESVLEYSLVNMPVSTVAHWIKISKQLASDNRALSAYVNTRMIYGVNRKVETQLVSGNGAAPNISGILDSGNYTAHGYSAAALGSTLQKLVLIRKMMADSAASGYAPDAILMNPIDWANIEIDLLTTTSNAVRVGVNSAGQQTLFGLPVIQSVGMTVDQVAVGAFGQAYMIHNREGVVVELSDSDSDNFTKNLVTIRAERRLALATERPAAVRAGDLTPA